MILKHLNPILMLILGSSTLLLLSFATSPHSQAQDDCTPRSLRGVGDWRLTDFCTASVDFSEIISGGPGKDGIPAITNPIMETISEASTWLGERAPVIVVEIEGEARAYPQAVLMWHEIANDEIAGVPVAVTFCPLCNSSIVFDRRLEDQVLELGVSGNLRNSDMVMYDRQTESWWQQFTGEGIVGHYTGSFLEIIPSQVVGFAQFAERYPDALVMSRDTGYSRNYGENPYLNYDSSRRPFLYRGEVDDRLPALAHVLAGVINETPIAYPFSVLSEQIVINDTVAELPVVAFWQPGKASALDQRVIDNSRDIGTAALFVREMNGQVLTFTINEVGALVDDQTGSTWNLFGEAIAGELAGQTLRQWVAAPHFWFAWVVFQPETLVYSMETQP